MPAWKYFSSMVGFGFFLAKPLRDQVRDAYRGKGLLPKKVELEL